MDFDKISQANEEEQAVQEFWQQQMFDICNSDVLKSDRPLPLARIKKIIKADKEVKVTAETPIVLAKACEIFIKELALRAWMCTEESKRRTVHYCDVAKAIQRGDVLDFLRGVVPTDYHQCCVHAQDDKEEMAEKSAEVTQSYTAGFVEPTKESMGN